MKLEDITENQTEEVRDLYHTLRNMVLKAIPKIDEEFIGGAKVRMSSYSIRQKMVCVISPAKDHCKLFLHHTDEIDTDGLLLEGKGKHARTVKIKSPDQNLLDRAERAVRDISSYLETID